MDNSLKAPTGVYKNPRLMYACTTIVGSTVHLQTKDGKVWEGIFNTFSPEFTICLDLAIQIDPKLDSKDCLYAALKSGLQAKKTAFFEPKDIVRISVLDVDLNYATKDLFSTSNINNKQLITDADISGYDPSSQTNKSSSEHRQLESWQDDDGDDVNPDTLLSLDDVPNSNSTGANKNGSNQNNSRGWDAQEMFRYNERVHKVTTTYDDKLTDYTVPLPKPNSTKDWRKKHNLASTIAQEIESNTKSQSRLAKEDEGDCEEEKFSAVLRPRPNSTIRNQAVPPTAADSSSGHEENTNKKTGQANNPVPEQQSTHHHHHQHQQSHHPQSPQQQQSQQPQPQSQQHRPSPLNSNAAQQQQQPSSLQANRSSAATKEDKVDEVDNNKYRPPPGARGNSGNQNGTHKNFPRRFERPRMDHNKHFDSLKNFGQKLTLAPSPRQPHHQNFNNQMQNSSNSQNQPSPLSGQHQQQQLQQNQQKQQAQHHSQHHQPLPQQHQQQSQQSQQPVQQQAQQPPQQSQQQPQQQQQPKPPHQQQQQVSVQQQQQQQNASSQVSVTISSPATATTSTPSSTVPNTNTISSDQRSDTTTTSNVVNTTNQAKDHQSELARKSKLNPHAKEFVYKPRSPAVNQGIQANGPNQGAPTSGAANTTPTIDPTNSSPMSQAQQHTPYYQPVSMFPVGLYSHQQQHHAQFMPNHTHPHFQNQIHYMSPVPPHFAQQMSQRYHIRGNFQNYHRSGGEHHNNVRADGYSQGSPMMAPTSTGQAFVPSPSGAPPPHLMNAYTTSQQPMIYNGPPQSMYPVVPTGFPQHVPHVMPNPPPYDGSTVYMPQQQNYIANP